MQLPRLLLKWTSALVVAVCAATSTWAKDAYQRLWPGPVGTYQEHLAGRQS